LISSTSSNSVLAEQINYTIFKRFDDLAAFANQELQWIISGLIEAKLIPYSDDALNWSIMPPCEFQVNSSRNNAATIEAIRAGIETPQRVIRAKGGNPRKFLRDKAIYMAGAKAVADEFGLDPEDIVMLKKPGDMTTSMMQQSNETQQDS
jgi:hypothetical protein